MASVNFLGLVSSLLLMVAAGRAAVPSEYLKERKVIENIYRRPANIFTETPIIGVLTLPVTVARQKIFGNSSFATSYVRWIEAGGARAVPILYDSTPDELEYLLKRINGVLWTGGLVDFNPEVTDPEGSKYLTTTEHIFKHVLADNQAGNYYPMWGTCLGFERMAQLFAGDVNATLLEEVDAENFGINLELTMSGWMSRLFGGMSYELFKEVASPLGHLAFNNHGLGIHPNNFEQSRVQSFLKVLSIDADRDGKLFVSTVEGWEYPFYGVQWHPEKAPWEWSLKYTMSHSEKAVEFSNYLGRFFVNECKYNKNSFESEVAVSRLLIANWRSRPTGAIHGIISTYSEIVYFLKRYPFTLRGGDEAPAAKATM